MESIPAVIIPLVSYNLIKLALDLMVLQMAVLIAPAIILGVIASNKKLMGDFILKGINKYIYWITIILIFITGVISTLPLVVKLG